MSQDCGVGTLRPVNNNNVFTCRELGAGTGTAASASLQVYPTSVAILADLYGKWSPPP